MLKDTQQYIITFILNLQPAYRSFFAMGTRMDIVLPSTEPARSDELYYLIKNETSRIESLLSTHIGNSIFSRINQSQGNEWVHTGKEMYYIFDKLLKYSNLTLGFFSITLPKNITGNISGTSNFTCLETDPENYSVRLDTNLFYLDPGAFGKGLALESVKNILHSSGFTNAFISFGESSVMVMGQHPHGDHWKVGIRDPLSPGSNAWVFELNDGSVSTSGNKPGDKEDKQHILNPLSGQWIKEKAMVSVCTGSAMEAEILSTALFAAGRQNAGSVLNNFPDAKAVWISFENEQTEIEILKPQSELN